MSSKCDSVSHENDDYTKIKRAISLTSVHEAGNSIIFLGDEKRKWNEYIQYHPDKRCTCHVLRHVGHTQRSGLRKQYAKEDHNDYP
uniref:Uncharacterized protein n=1 Tax=Physcomitrium patens TaxID=3218 RepID=A0A2K1KEI1_PHYPA|nr:hypothetical protein PHYPA_008557 [Physcomitrium patens]